MADISPFRGLRFNADKVNDLSSVITPPYDVISPLEQRRYHAADPYNVIRLELGEELPGDTPLENKYTRANATIRNWLEEGVLLREPVPAYYLLEHRFVLNGCLMSRLGLVGRMRLDNGAGARPHETVMQSRVDDRLSLLRHTRVNISTVLGMARKQEPGLASVFSAVITSGPDLSAVDHDGVIHNVWIISEAERKAYIAEWCRSRVVYIADGHHRYQTSQLYQAERLAAGDKSDGPNFVMMTLMDAGDDGLVALPTHRLLRLPNGVQMSFVEGKLAAHFHAELIGPGQDPSSTAESWLRTLESRGKGNAVFGAYGLHGRQLCLYETKDRPKLQAMLPAEKSDAWKSLDVSVIHSVVFKDAAGIDGPETEERSLKYTRSAEEAINLVDRGEYHMAFLVNPISIETILAVADTGDRMPPKSTYFHPKIPTGLVMYPLWD